MGAQRLCAVVWEAYRAIVSGRATFRNDGGVNAAIVSLCRLLADGRRGFALLGTVGNGKTTLLRAVQRAVLAMDGLGMFPEATALRIVAARSVHRDGSPRFESLCREPWLAIDDLGTEPTETLVYGNPLTPVADTLLRRYERRLFTVISTNLTPRERLDKYGQRITDRLREMCTTITFDHESFRKC